MITILNISDTKFSYNGIAYFKNFTPFVTGNKVSIVNTYDACISLTNFPTIYSDISVDGVTYGSVAALQNALLPVLFNRTFTQAGSLAIGFIPKSNGSNSLVNSVIYENGSGNVGIGTTQAFGKLTLGGGKFYIAYASNSDIGATIYSYNNTAYQPYAGGLKFQVFRNETGAYLMYDAMTLDAAGRLAIGTTNNIHDKLHIQNGSAANTTISIQSWGTEAAGEYAGIRFKSATTSSNEYGKGFIGFRNNGTGYGRGDLYFCLNNNTDTTNASPSDVKVIINASGAVGIGTTDPFPFKLAVTGTTAAYGTLGSIYGSFYLDHPAVQSWKIGVSAVNTSMFSIGNDVGGSFANKILNITNAGNVLLGTTSDTGDRVNVNGSLRATAFNMVGNYNATISTNSGWSSFQTLVPIGTLNAYSTYFISVWHTSSGGGQPYEVACSFMYSAVGTNGGGVDNEFTPIVATHTGGTGAIMTFRSRSGNGSISGLEVKFTNFNVPTGTIFVKATKVQGF